MAKQPSKAVLNLINELNRHHEELVTIHGWVLNEPISNEKTYRLHQINTMLQLSETWRNHFLGLDDFVYVNWSEQEQEARGVGIQITGLCLRMRDWLNRA